MANLRPDYWQAGTLSLHTHAHHLEVTPPVRISGRKGGNLDPVGIDGETYKPKPWAPATRLLTGWLSDRSPDGALASTSALRIARREDNVALLTAALVAGGGQVTITKRRLELDGLGGTVVAVYTAAGELLDLEIAYDQTVDRDGAALAAWTAEIHYADPWWYAGATKDHLG